jgi:hypothetical protein
MVVNMISKHQEHTVDVETIPGELWLSIIAQEDIGPCMVRNDGRVEMAIKMSEENMNYIAWKILYNLTAKKQPDGNLPKFEDWKKAFCKKMGEIYE